MIILHVSDTHGPVPWKKLPEDFDILCHSGDWAPDHPNTDSRPDTISHQRAFFEREGPCMAAWLGERPLVFCLGNHDLLSEAWVERSLMNNGVNAFAPGPEGSVVTLKGQQSVLFRGFRFTPYIHDGFEGGCEEHDLEYRVEAMAAQWRPRDVLVAHCPPQGEAVAPFPQHWGNRALLGALLEPLAPRVVLCGHLHENGGSVTVIKDTLVYNSARRYSLVEIL